MGGVGEEDGDDVSDEMFVLIEIMVCEFAVLLHLSETLKEKVLTRR